MLKRGEAKSGARAVTGQRHKRGALRRRDAPLPRQHPSADKRQSGRQLSWREAARNGGS